MQPEIRKEMDVQIAQSIRTWNESKEFKSKPDGRQGQESWDVTETTTLLTWPRPDHRAPSCQLQHTLPIMVVPVHLSPLLSSITVPSNLLYSTSCGLTIHSSPQWCAICIFSQSETVQSNASLFFTTNDHRNVPQPVFLILWTQMFCNEQSSHPLLTCATRLTTCMPPPPAACPTVV